MTFIRVLSARPFFPFSFYHRHLCYLSVQLANNAPILNAVAGSHICPHANAKPQPQPKSLAKTHAAAQPPTDANSISFADADALAAPYKVLIKGHI